MFFKVFANFMLSPCHLVTLSSCHHIIIIFHDDDNENALISCYLCHPLIISRHHSARAYRAIRMGIHSYRSIGPSMIINNHGPNKSVTLSPCHLVLGYLGFINMLAQTLTTFLPSTDISIACDCIYHTYERTCECVKATVRQWRSTDCNPCAAPE